jgi:hypothetical protein
MAKPMLVTLPFTLLLLDYWPLKRFQQKNPFGKFVSRSQSLYLLIKEKGNRAEITPPDLSRGGLCIEYRCRLFCFFSELRELFRRAPFQ